MSNETPQGKVTYMLDLSYGQKSGCKSRPKNTARAILRKLRPKKSDIPRLSDGGVVCDPTAAAETIESFTVRSGHQPPGGVGALTRDLAKWKKSKFVTRKKKKKKKRLKNCRC